jgi:FlaG/FlaF family flagellin (archaellin)
LSIINPKDLAKALVGAAASSTGEVMVTLQVGGFSSSQLQELFDEVSKLISKAQVTLKGVRLDATSFGKLGITQDTGNSGTYKNVPVVKTPTVDFDTVEFEFKP